MYIFVYLEKEKKKKVNGVVFKLDCVWFLISRKL